MHQGEIDQLMKPRDGKRAKAPAMKSRLGPREIRELGDNVQVWAIRMLGVMPDSLTATALQFAGAFLTDGDRRIYLKASDFTGETTGEKVRGGRSKKVFRGLKVADFVETIYRKIPKATGKTRIILVTFDTAENTGALDLHDLDSRFNLHPIGPKIALSYHDKKCGHSLEFIDLSAFFPDQTLRDVATNYGLNIEVHQPAHPLTDELGTRAYLRSEVRAIWGVWAALRGGMTRTWGIDPAVYRTPASCAARAYTGHYLKQYPGAVTKAVRLQAMRCYWGGRIEAFKRGEQVGEIAVYDAVSLYPQSAINLKVMPRADDWYRLTMKRLQTCAGGLCTASFEFPADELCPCLPVHAGGKTYYPLAGISHCTAHELRYALELGASVQLLEGWGYDQGDETLAAYSRDMLAAKNAADMAGDYAGRTLAKLMLNTLYGKFGQHHIGHSLETLREICRTYNYPDVPALLRTANWEQEITQETGEIIEPEINISDYWQPEWAALINGYARYIESRAMREYVALTGTIDSIIIPGDAGEYLDIDGVRFRRELIGDRLVSVRARLYAVTKNGEVVKAALHGAPLVKGMAEKVAAWNGEPRLSIKALRVRQVREGVTTGQIIGHGKFVEQSVETDWDNRRELTHDYSKPFDRIPPRVDTEQVERINELDAQLSAKITVPEQ